MKFHSLLISGLALALASGCSHLPTGKFGWTSLNDGKTFNGWKMAQENQNTWSIKDGAFVAHGERCHLFYDGALAPFKDFEFMVDVMTEPGSNGGVYFHTKYQDTGWPKYGFETQVNVTHTDWKKTGSLYDVVNLKSTPAKDNKWWNHHIIVKGNHVTVKVDGVTVMDYEEPAGKQPGADFTRKLDQGTFAFQAHDPKSVVHYRNIWVKRL